MSKPYVSKERAHQPVTASSLDAAIKRGRKRRESLLQAKTVAYLAITKSLMIGFSDDSAVLLPIKNYPELATLSKSELSRLSLGFGGSALCFHKNDLHISIAGLIAASEPLMSMASVMTASRNGKLHSEAKATAARANGLKGEMAIGTAHYRIQHIAVTITGVELWLLMHAWILSWSRPTRSTLAELQRYRERLLQSLYAKQPKKKLLPFLIMKPRPK
jgi:hypothetical protein